MDNLVNKEAIPQNLRAFRLGNGDFSNVKFYISGTEIVPKKGMVLADRVDFWRVEITPELLPEGKILEIDLMWCQGQK